MIWLLGVALLWPAALWAAEPPSLEDLPFAVEEALNLGDDAILRDYAQIGFGSEHAPDANLYVLKWDHPIKVLLKPTPPPTVFAAIERTLAAISTATGIEVRGARGAADADILILFPNDSEYEEIQRRHFPPKVRIPPGGCSVRAFAEPRRFTLQVALVLVPQRLSAEAQAGCASEEIAQAFGLPNDSTEAEPSVFNDDNRFTELTPHDLLLLRIHYDPRIAPGTHRARAIEIGREILQEIRAAAH